MIPDSPSPDRRRVRSLARRELLKSGGLAGAVLLAGCTEDIGEEFPPNRKYPLADVRPELPVTERTDILEERIEATAALSIESGEEFAAAFEEYALEVESVGRERDVLTLEYVNAEREGSLHDVGLIAGAYAALVDSGYDAVALEITILDPAPATFGAAVVDTGWAEAYNAGALSAKEYGELVATTVESKRRPPEVGASPTE